MDGSDKLSTKKMYPEGEPFHSLPSDLLIDLLIDVIGFGWTTQCRAALRPTRVHAVTQTDPRDEQILGQPVRRQCGL